MRRFGGLAALAALGALSAAGTWCPRGGVRARSHQRLSLVSALRGPEGEKQVTNGVVLVKRRTAAGDVTIRRPCATRWTLRFWREKAERRRTGGPGEGPGRATAPRRLATPEVPSA